MTTESLDEQVPVQFYRKIKKEDKEKIENIQAWIKTKPDNGLWAFVFIDNKKEIFSFYGQELSEDKNHLQLIPLIELLEWIDEPEKKKNLLVYTKSSYVVNCLTEWIDKWKRTDFKIEDKKDRPNADLLRKIDKLKTNITVTVKLLMAENDFSKQSEELITKYND